jgi:hypothetical protein
MTQKSAVLKIRNALRKWYGEVANELRIANSAGLL